MQYLIDNVSEELDRGVRLVAEREGRSLNDVVLDALEVAIWRATAPRLRDLSDIAGRHHFDAGFDEAMEEQSRIEPEDWK